jgi:hypothetical protein
VRQINVFESEKAHELLEESGSGITAGCHRVSGAQPLLQLSVVQAEAA